MKNLAIIPARKGSKGVPNKNIKLLGDQPMISYSIAAAKQAEIFDEIHISTDSREIADVSERHGIKIPDLRPDNLAEDTTPMLNVIEYVLDLYSKRNINFDTVTLLQPTAPLRTASDIKAAYTKFISGNFDSLISVKRVPDHYNPHWVYIQKNDSLKLFSGAQQPIARRQELPQAFIREGSLYMFKPETVRKFNNIYGETIAYYEIRRQTVNIDTMDDFIEAEKILKSSI